MNVKLHAGPTAVLLAMGWIALIPVFVFASAPSFAGTWNAKVKLVIGASVSMSRGRGPVPLPDSTIPFPDAAVGAESRGASGTRVTAGPRGNANAGKEITVKIELHVLFDKDKVTGHLTFNPSGGGFDFAPGISQEIYDGKIDGNILTFRTVSSSGAILSGYAATLVGNKLSITRTPAIDQTDFLQFTMTRGK